MSWLFPHKTLTALLVLLVFAFSANAFLFGSHSAEEMWGASPLSATADEDVHHDHHGEDHGETQDESHCCDTQHSHDVTEGPQLALESPYAFSVIYGLEPITYPPEVFYDRFIPPQNRI